MRASCGKDGVEPTDPRHRLQEVMGILLIFLAFMGLGPLMDSMIKLLLSVVRRAAAIM
jgi:hypothetical protein